MNDKEIAALLASCGLNRYADSSRDTFLQRFCSDFCTSEQRWIAARALSYNRPHKPVLVVCSDENAHTPACVITHPNHSCSLIVISVRLIYQLDEFFKQALVDTSLLQDLGYNWIEVLACDYRDDSGFESGTRSILSPAADACTVHALRVVIGHELSHIENGHMNIARSGHMYLDETIRNDKDCDNMLSQTLEMDADCGAAVKAFELLMPLVRSRLDADHLAGNEAYLPLALFVFSAYSLLRFLHGKASGKQSDFSVASHPPVLVRSIFLIGTLHALLEKEGLSGDFALQLVTEWFRLAEKTFRQYEKSPPAGLKEALSQERRAWGLQLLQNWKDVRPLLEPYAVGPKLAPSPA